MKNKALVGTVHDIFEKLDMMVDPSNVKNIHWIKSSKDPEKVIMKLSRGKNANKISLLKKGLKGINLRLLGINSTVFINDSLCNYCIIKCKEVNFGNFC